MKNIAILGSTGSIGTQTLEIVRENPDLAVRYGVRQAPTLVVDGADPVKVVGLGAIRSFAQENRPASVG